MLTLLLLGAASAATNELDFEGGWLHGDDDGWAVVADAPVLSTLGFRLGYAVTPRLAVVGGLQFGSAGQTVYPGESYESETFRAAFYGQELTAGVKGDIRVASWLHPYATVQLVGLRGVVRMDDDLAHNDNATQRKEAGVTAGGMAALGLEFPIGLPGGVLSIAPYTELGYAYTGALQVGDFGELRLRGFTGRLGVGLRF